MVNYVSLIAPLSYIVVLVGSLGIFSSLYRKRKAAKAASLEPWFPPHTARDIYLSLLHLEGSKAVPDSVLKAALVMRAKEDIRRLMALRQSKNSLQVLLQKGCVGDDLWTRFSAAEAENEEVCLSWPHDLLNSSQLIVHRNSGTWSWRPMPTRRVGARSSSRRPAKWSTTTASACVRPRLAPMPKRSANGGMRSAPGLPAS